MTDPNKHRAAVVRARLRCALLEQAVKWCRGRIAVLERSEAIAVDDVVQIHPGHHCLGGMLAFVAEVRTWGILADVPVPGRGVAPVRLGPNEYVRVGRAPYEEA